MPEAAECKIETEFLNSELEGEVIVSWNFLSGQYYNITPPGFEEFEESLPLMVEQVSCKGKLLYFVIYNEEKTFYIMHSLRLTGYWSRKQTATSRWYIETDSGKRLWLNDPRCFATLDFIDNEILFQKMLDRIGPSILSPEFTPQIWDELLQKHKNKNITAFLMDQSIISGCGNYTKAEALYHSKISPMRKVKDLHANERRSLYEALRIIPRLVYTGHTIDEMSDTNIQTPSHGFGFKIYGKSFATRTKTPDGRVTHWDPEVQK